MAKADKDNTSSQFMKVEDKIENAILETRRLFLSDAIDNNTSDDLIRKLWYLEIQDPGKPILLVINSPGGSVDAGFAVWDQVKMISSPVTTLITGLAASMGSILSLCAAPKRRFATPHARIMIHQPRLSGAIQGQATDLDIHAKEMIKTRNLLVKIYVDATGKTPAEIERAVDRDTWMTVEEAMAFGPHGLLDGVISSYSELKF